ncbi:PREDICTED: pyruvate dehydrogenase [acetyl-transferring]-phosphatase 1, mitochondrial-like [Rhagoletis zephyria]|uniref:pyruvate dehydrogenase [acetyl-transferring]-phosphatase 1, mitochondrial-like n=1 Tax=Rhagoletis zephyria TaxID=28612 RepID=UPI0008112847|nr:PREDICTED: pyruvate dehydrogenase [acetyl-transferring]-phosphatase 1, mitochondrial-like [Rhagoletis zephyria]
MAFGVFDGHSGGLCADLISRRLFHYIAIALRALELRSSGAASSVKPAFSVDILQKIARDHTKSPPDFYHNIHVVYEESIAERLQARIEEFEWRSLEAFAIEELDYEDLPTTDDVDGSAKIESALRRAFLACDRDLSREIQANLLNTSSNVLLHYYLSLAISGSCATVVILYKNEAFIASAGDTKAVMGTLKQAELKAEVPESDSKVKPITRKILKSTELSFEHNSENIKELNRLMSEHPKDEQNYIIRENRLLGSLMPLRAFGDFSFKWSVEKMKQLGITRAFGSHIIPTHYKTPPYLTAEPEITKLSLVEDADECAGEEDTIQLDRFIILATDGLWEQFEGARKVVQAVNRYRQNVQQQIDAFTSANLFKFDDSKDGDSKDLEEDSDNDDSPLTIGKIVDRLRKKVTDPPAAIFERITADDDLIEDINCGTYLLRTALSDTSAGGLTSDGELAYEEEEKEKFSHHEDQYEQQRKRHDKLVGFLTLPQSVVRNFRDDISLIVIGLK